DFLRIYFRNDAVVVRQRFWRSRPPDPRIDRQRRSGRCLCDRDLSDPGHVLCHRTIFRGARKQGGTAVRGKASSMIGNLPKPIALYLSAENSGDTTLFDECFAADAIVRDESETHNGFGAVKKLKAETKRKYRHTVDPLRIAEQNGTFVLTNRLTGNFPGSPIE